ncbi:TetR/AcrR family transcriptional regulator [Agaribacter flavus]|uniref:TetR/AcrR family transcriptional regulator n=2 Tax=Agaribacter flavus TaxID=1902781 RepID=A0ABV7FTS2_9ALTE
MPRKPKYRLDLVFEYAIPVALKHGYRGCSMQDLLTKTGFNRRAFYLEFGNKQGFYEALTKHYITQYLQPLETHLQQSEHAHSDISNYFLAYEKLIVNKGCLLINLLLEMGKQSKAIQHAGRQHYDRLQQLFISVLERAKEHGQLATSVDIEREALQLSFLTQGFAVSTALEQGKEDIKTVVDALFST